MTENNTLMKYAARYKQRDLSETDTLDSLEPPDLRRLALDTGLALIGIIAAEYFFRMLVRLVLGIIIDAGIITDPIVFSIVLYLASCMISYLPKIFILYILYDKYRPLFRLYPRYENGIYHPVLLVPAIFAMGMWGSNITNLINYVLQILFGAGEIPNIMEQTAPDSFASAIVSVGASALIAPIAEEFIYRKLLLKPLRALGDTPAIVLSALIFGLAHGNFDQFAYSFFGGIIFGLTAVRFGSIALPIILHMINNFFVSVVVYGEELLCGIPFFDNIIYSAARMGNHLTILSYYGGIFVIILLIATKFTRLVPASKVCRYEKLRTVFCPVLMLALAAMLLMFALY